MKKVYIAVICLSAVLCGVFGVLFFRDYFSQNAASATADSAPTTAREDVEQNETLSQGESRVLALNDADEADVSKWASSDSSVIAVDSGGRVDALKTGTADVTATFSDGHIYTYHLTVTKAEPKEKRDLFSTAITANADVVQKNLKSESDRLPYEIQVNRKQNCVTVYTYDKDGNYTVPVRAMVCSCGKNNATDTGEFYIYLHTDWHPLVNDVFGQYASSFSDELLFHSVPYTDLAKNTLKTDEFNKLGEAASKGCVRMAVSDCKWLCDNIAPDTVVKIFDSDDPLPLGKPETIRITDKTLGWDPTDNDRENPYNSKFPTISGAWDTTLSRGADYDIKSGVTARDTCSNDISDKLEIIGSVNPDRAGVYKVTYTVTDALNRSARKDITVTVEE